MSSHPGKWQAATRQQLVSRLVAMTPAERKLLMSHISGKFPAGPRPLRRGPTPNIFPVSTSQRQLWVLQQLEPSSGAYTASTAVRFKGALSTACLETALLEIEARHEILRTAFPYSNGEPVQMIYEPRNTPLSIIDLRLMPGATSERWIAGFIRVEAIRPFDLERLPLLRKSLVAVSDSEHVLVVSMHHLLSDEWSTEMMIRELTEIYAALRAGEPSRPSPPELQYADYAVWQLERNKTEAARRQIDYWRGALDGVRDLNLPIDYARPPIPSRRGAVFQQKLHHRLRGQARQLAERLGATLFMVHLAAFQAFLALWSRSQDIVVGTPVANRSVAEVENTLGFFVNMVVIRTSVDLKLSFAELVANIRRTALDVYANQDVPFETVVDALKPERSFGSTPLFQVIFQLIDEPVFAWPDAETQIIPVPRTTSKFDLSLYVRRAPDGVQAEWNYSTELFAPATIQDAAVSHASLLEALLANPEEPMRGLVGLSGSKVFKLS
jgi:hypothetical protein